MYIWFYGELQRCRIAERIMGNTSAHCEELGVSLGKCGAFHNHVHLWQMMNRRPALMISRPHWASVTVTVSVIMMSRWTWGTFTVFLHQLSKQETVVTLLAEPVFFHWRDSPRYHAALGVREHEGAINTPHMILCAFWSPTKTKTNCSPTQTRL